MRKEKCQILSNKVSLKVTNLGVHPTAVKVEAVKEAPEPRNTTQLRAFFELVNYHRRFISQHGQPLTTYNDLLSRQKSQWAELPPEEKQAFEIIKQKLAMAPCLNHFHADVPALLGTDASQYGVGAVQL